MTSKRTMTWRTKDKLAKVAAIYGSARDEGKPPTQTVADRLGVTYGQAANLVAKARANNYLKGTAWDGPAGRAEVSDLT